MRFPVLCSIVMLSLAVSEFLFAQNVRPISSRTRTEIEFELLLPRQYSSGLIAQQWHQRFEQLQIPLRVRQPVFNDEAGVKEQTFGTVRRITVIGQLDRSGQIVLPDRTFRREDLAKLKQWIEDLKTYGAQGSPDGQPLWGLNESQFEAIRKQFADPVSFSTKNMSLTAALKQMEFPQETPWRFSIETREQLVARGELPPIGYELEGLSKGTATAMILRDYGLGLAPRRVPDGSIVLQIDPIEKMEKAWPIGWDPESLGLKRLSIARTLFTAQAIQIQSQPLTDVFEMISSETKIPIYVDESSLRELSVNPEKLVVNFPPKRTSWSLCLRTIVSQVKLTQDIRVDEASQPFVWVSLYRPKQAAQGNFQRVIR